MEYWTIYEPLEGRYRLLINFGGRGFWCEFDYLVLHAEGLEGVEVVHPATPDGELRTWFPSISRGIDRAIQTFREKGRLIVMFHIEITKVYTHPVSTTEHGCESYGFRFFHDIVQRHGRRIPPLASSTVEWNHGTVARIAQAIHDERAFDRLPILADALEEAGCQDADILGHCRHPGPHVRGCWAVDLLLVKE